MELLATKRHGGGGAPCHEEAFDRNGRRQGARTAGRRLALLN